MDRRLAWGAALGAPALFAAMWALSAPFGPLAAWAAGLCLYWLALAWALRRMDPAALWALAEARWPGWAVAAAMGLPAVVLGARALRALGRDPLPAPVLLAVALGALAHGVLEELFWRGALLPRPGPRAAAGALAMFALFHLSWAGAAGLSLPGGLLGTAAAALALGGAWTASRLLTGTVGGAAMAHAALALFAFALIAARNHP